MTPNLHPDFRPGPLGEPPEERFNLRGCVGGALSAALFTLGFVGALASLAIGGNVFTWVGSTMCMASGAVLFIWWTR